MRELPVIFSAPMVRAILDGRKAAADRILEVESETAAQPSHTPAA